MFGSTTRTTLIALTVGTLAMLAIPFTADAATIAYWRHEGTVGTEVPADTDGTNGGGSVDNTVLDSSGNGNHMESFADWTNSGTLDTTAVYVASVPAPTVSNTGAVNTSSLDFQIGGDANDDNYTTGGGNLNNYVFSAWTVELSMNLDAVSGVDRPMGKDRVGGGPGAGPLQVVVVDQGSGTYDVRMEIFDGSNTFHAVISGTYSTGQWINVAATATSTLLSLYIDSGSGYQLVDSEAISGALLNGNSTWTIGRGYFNGINDWIDGRIDEVRISDVALAPNQFLFSVPTPAALPAGLALLIAIGARRRV